MQRGYTWEGGFDTPKTESSARDVPLTWDAIEALEQQRKQGNKSELVFPDERGEVGSVHSTGHYIGKLSQLAGMRHVHPHVMRHSFASHAVMRGVPLKLVQEWMGHATIQMTMRYSHLAAGLGDEMIKRLAPRSGDLSLLSVKTAQHNDSTGNSTTSQTGS